MDNNNTQENEQTSEVKDASTENKEQTEEDQEYMKAKLNEGYFSEVDIEFTYAENKEYEAEIDEDDGKIKAKIENDLTGERIKGKEAFDFIYSKLENLNITSTSDKQETIRQIMQAFDLPSDYKKVEITVEFHNGEELKIKENGEQ